MGSTISIAPFGRWQRSIEIVNVVYTPYLGAQRSREPQFFENQHLPLPFKGGKSKG
jgi:hypothetical protein